MAVYHLEKIVFGNGVMASTLAFWAKAKFVLIWVSLGARARAFS